MAETRVHLVRHGEVENPQGLSYGRLPGFSLSARGRAQAKAAADYLRSTGGAIRHLYSSPLERACESAAIHADAFGLEPVVDPRLIEIGSWRDGLPHSFSPVAYALRYSDGEARRRNESPHAVMERTAALVNQARAGLSNPGDAAVLVSHQWPIWLCRLAFERAATERQGLVWKLWPWAYVKYPGALASVTTLVFDGDSLRQVRYFAPPV
jgi:broad specificity phosphatase PhoE